MGYMEFRKRLEVILEIPPRLKYEILSAEGLFTEEALIQIAQIK